MTMMPPDLPRLGRAPWLIRAHGSRGIGPLLQRCPKWADLIGNHWTRQWQTDDTSTPVAAAGQPVGRIEARGHVAPLSYSNTVAGAYPTSGAAGLGFDGGDYMEGGSNLRDLLRGVGAWGFMVRGTVDGPPSPPRIICAFSSGVGVTAVRQLLAITSTGAIQLQARRADPDSVTSLSTATGLVTAGAPFSLIATVNLEVGGANAMQVYLDGSADLLAGTLSGSGNSQDSASLRARLGASLAASPGNFFSGQLRRLAIATGPAALAIPTAAERAAIFAELAAA